MKSSKNRTFEVEDLYRPIGRNEKIMRNELNDDNSVVSIDPHSKHVTCSLEMDLLPDETHTEVINHEYSNAGQSEKEYLACRDALEETLTLLTGSDDDDKRKSCTKLVAAVFVLSQVVHEFSAFVSKHDVKKHRVQTQYELIPDEAELDKSKLISQTQQILLSLEELVKEIQVLGKHSEQFQKSISNAYRFCADVQRQGNSEWNGERLIVPNTKVYYHSINSNNSAAAFNDDQYETQWILLVQSNQTKRIDEKPAPKLLSFSLFSTKSFDNKISMLIELIRKTRLLIALAHFQLQIARKTFSLASATKLFQGNSRHLLRWKRESQTTKSITWAIGMVQKLFPTTRSLITLINSICEIIQPAEIISRLTHTFLSQMHSVAFRKSLSCGDAMSKLFCIAMFSNMMSSTSKTWFKIELMLNSFADSLCIEEITLLLEKDCLVLGRNYKKTSSGFVIPNRISSKLEVEIQSSNSQEPLDWKDSSDPDRDTITTVYNLVANVPADPYDSQFQSESQEFSQTEDIMIPNHLANPDVILAAAGLSQTVLDVEGNFEESNNPNFLGPILIEVDMEGCPRSPSTPDWDEDFHEISESNMNSEFGEDDSINLTFNTLNFLLLIYNWWQIYSPGIIPMLQKKINDKLFKKIERKISADEIKQNVMMQTVGDEVKEEIPMKDGPTESVKRVKSVRMDVPDKTAIEHASSALIRWKDSKRSDFRRSSVPFADRTPKVRFNRVETCITSLKQGPHKPVLGGSSQENVLLKSMKSILKKTEHPILVDMTLLATSTTTRKSKALSNDELILCVSIVERIIAQFSKAERQIRGVFDILTFPASRMDCVEVIGRFKANIMIAIDILRRLSVADDLHVQGNTQRAAGGTGDSSTEVASTVSGSRIAESVAMTDINELCEALSLGAGSCSTFAKKFLSSNKKLTNQWEQILQRKGEFYIPHEKSKQAIYPQEIMPENVTLYEDVVDSPYRVEGNLIILWTRKDTSISTDLDPTTIDFEKSDLEDKFELLETILFHSHELLKYAEVHLRTAVESVNDASLAHGYENIKSRIVDLQFDAFFDPLCALELKNTLGELMMRSGELLNLAEKLDEMVDWMRKMISSMRTFSTQLLSGDKKGDKKYRGMICNFCASSTFVSSEDLFANMGHIPLCDLWITIPMSSALQTTMTKLQTEAKARTARNE